ncbi:MAG: SUF system Fe-S cluster assembly protein [Deltaproteobacteria bacterium]|nr:SUF system Fe-S cluster assembly protein [Deltaproteobacteria bacterium]
MSGSAGEAAAMLETNEEGSLEEQVIAAIQTVHDPEIPVNVYDLGLIYEVDLLPLGRINIQMTLTSPACPVAGSLPGEVEDAVRRVEGVQDVQVELVWDPPWDFDMMTEDAKLELNLL